MKIKYYIPEWDDRIDADYSYLTDKHSETHESNKMNDRYMWQIFGDARTPFDGVLFSLMTFKKKPVRESEIRSIGGFRKYLSLPGRIKILADCGAWSYMKDDKPPFDAVEVLEQYKALGVEEGVTVDHLVFPDKNPAKRMEITAHNGIRGFDAWEKNFRKDFDLLVSVQGLRVQDYTQMLERYLNHGITKFAFGGLAKKTSDFIMRLTVALIQENDRLRNQVERIHFFGLGRPELFPLFSQLEEHGIEISFDTSSWLRRAWLNGHYYSVEDGGLKQYVSMRVQMTDPEHSSFKGKRKLSSFADYPSLARMEDQCLRNLRSYEKGGIQSERVLRDLNLFHSRIIEERVKFYQEEEMDQDWIEEKHRDMLNLESRLQESYKQVLEDKPWEKCDCAICKRIGIEVIIFRGNNRNRARGFHDVYTMYHDFLHQPALWKQRLKVHGEMASVGEEELERLSGKVLVVTGCSKTKLGYTSSTRARAAEMYQGRLFREVKNYARGKGFPLMIISAKYGLIPSDRLIEGYEKVLSSREDVDRIKPLVTPLITRIASEYETVLVIAGLRYREALEDAWTGKFLYVKASGYAKLAQTVREAVEADQPKLQAFL